MIRRTKLLGICGVVLVVVLALTLGLVFGLQSDDDGGDELGASCEEKGDHKSQDKKGNVFD
uniref:Uncharacterized protein n=1 Tax=Anopheles merus TaxID=30066 RepID=A0A182UQM0_ANOME